MTTAGNGSTNLPGGNGNNRGRWANFGIEAGVLGVAEFVSSVVSLGVVAIADRVAPQSIEHGGKMVGKILSPYLETIESGMSRICKIEECQPDKSKSREERSEEMGKAVILFGSAFAVSFLFKLATRVSLNYLCGVGSNKVPTGNFWKDYLKPSWHDLKVIGVDEGIHLGSMYVLNNRSAGFTESLLKGTTHTLEDMGFSKKKAKEIASMGVIWELPNALGWLAGVGMIAKDTFFKKGGGGGSFTSRLGDGGGPKTPQI